MALTVEDPIHEQGLRERGDEARRDFNPREVTATQGIN